MAIDSIVSPATHIPVLTSAVMQTVGPVLELGMGHYSTPLLHSLCVPARRRLLSVESNTTNPADAQAIYDSFADLAGPYHTIEMVPSWAEWTNTESFDVALIDCAPAEARIETIRRLRGRVRFFICHDAEPANEGSYHYHRVIPDFKHAFRYRKFWTETVVLSDEPFTMP